MSELKKYQMFIDGEWVDSESKKTFETLNPENNKPWAIVPEARQKMSIKQLRQPKKLLKVIGQNYCREKEQNS